MRQFLNVRYFNLMVPVLAMALSGCQGLQTRGEIKRDGTQSGRTQAPSGTVPGTPPLETAQPDAEDDGAGALPEQVQAEEPETFLTKELPKVGVILGPGGLKAYAHIGVLREFDRARIPIHAIAGLEWGALMGAFYAEKGLANDVDWKAFRLREGDVPSSGVLRGYRAKPMSDFDSYLSIVIPGGSLETSKVPFGCPTIVRRDRLQWLAKGATKEIVSRCMPYPPLLGAAADNIAAPMAIEEAAKWLRSKGANLIVLVNVLGSGEPLSSRLAEDQYGTSVLWTEIRRELLSVRAPTVNWIVSVNTSKQKLDDFDKRRAAVELGSRAAKDLTTKLTKQYGF